MSYHFKFKVVYLLCAIYFTYYSISKCYCEKNTYISLERPHLLYNNEDLATNITVKSQRVSRRDPVHYVNISFYLKKIANNDYKNSFYVYQLLSNVYKRSFVEFNLYTCDLFKSDNLFSAALVPAYYRQSFWERPYPLLQCPLLPGFYRFDLMKVHSKYIPKSFPFNEGRAYYNLTLRNNLIVNVHMDFALMTSN